MSLTTRPLEERVCKDFASIVPRLYSAASWPVVYNSEYILEEGSGNVVAIIVKAEPIQRTPISPEHESRCPQDALQPKQV